jgi:hypothetical protein
MASKMLQASNSYGGHPIMAPGFQTSRIPFKKCVSRHGLPSVSHREGVSLSLLRSSGGRQLLVHLLPKITRTGHICASSTASAVSSQGEQPPYVPKQSIVDKNSDDPGFWEFFVKTMVFATNFSALFMCLAESRFQSASTVLTLYI